MQCDEILRLIRAMKTYNLHSVEVGDLKLLRIRDDGTVAPPTPEQVKQVQEEQQQLVLQEIDEYEKENLLISDPEEYEKRVGNV